MIDASHVKADPHAIGAKRGNQEMSRIKGGSTQKYIEHVVPLRGIINGWGGAALLADRVFDLDCIIEEDSGHRSIQCFPKE
jgi:hypothetical protein